MSANSSTPARRSPCPVACSLDLFGDRWTLLVVRDLILGKSRYKEFSASPEGIPTNILADRLDRLVRHGIARRIPVSQGAGHRGYELTEKGHSLKPLLRLLRDWGLKWERGTKAALQPVSRPAKVSS
ncbi:MAG: winged helix-turn-helix transcriptional regulator [Terrimicrobiaceae bacterium]